MSEPSQKVRDERKRLACNLLDNGWEVTVVPYTATHGSGENLYHLIQQPQGTLFFGKFRNLSFKDACTVQECIEKLKEKGMP